MIMIIFQSMVRMGNASDQSSEHKIDTLKTTMINEGILIIALNEVKSNWSRISIRENIYIRTDGWFKKGGLAQDITKSPYRVDNFKAELQLSCM